MLTQERDILQHVGRRRRIARDFPRAAFALPVVLAAMTALPSRAHAQAARDPAAAGAAFSRARDAIKRGDVETACELFAESVRLDPAPGAKLNLADCDERRGRVASASQEFRDALESLPSGDSRVAYAQERLTKLAPRVPALVLRASPELPPDAQVLRDGQVVAGASFGAPVPADPRAHEIRVRVRGRIDAVQTVTLREGETKEVVLVAGPMAPAAPPAPPVVALATPPAPASRGALPWGLVTTGGVAIVGGAVLGVLTLDRAATVKEHCDPGCDDTGYDAGRQGRWMSVASPIALGLGVALVAAGIYLFVDRRADAPSLTKVAW